MRFGFQILCGTLLLSSAILAGAQEPPAHKPPPSPEEIQKTINSTMGAMVPMMARMTEATLEAQLRIAERPETAARLAAFKRNLFLELQKQGFTAAQAMQITLNASPPSGMGSSK